MGDGDHGWAAAETLNLLRDFAVREDRGRLLLASGAPAFWFECPGRLKVSGAPTLYGTVSYTLDWDDQDLRLDWNIHRAPHQESVPLALHLPWEAWQKFAPSTGNLGVTVDRLGSSLTLDSETGSLQLSHLFQHSASKAATYA
jgi:hypothetical protein